MKVSKNAYYYKYNWCKAKDIALTITPKTQLKQRIKFIFEGILEIYSSYRIQKKLEREGLFYSHSYIGLLIKKMDLRSVLKRKFVITTASKHQCLISDNELNRGFYTLKLVENGFLISHIFELMIIGTINNYYRSC